MTQEILINTIDGKQYRYNTEKWTIDYDNDFINLDDFTSGNTIRFITNNVIKFQFLEV